MEAEAEASGRAPLRLGRARRPACRLAVWNVCPAHMPGLASPAAFPPDELRCDSKSEAESPSCATKRDEHEGAQRGAERTLAGER